MGGEGRGEPPFLGVERNNPAGEKSEAALNKS